MTTVIFLDLETEGTDPNRDRILEVSAFPVNLETLERLPGYINRIVRQKDLRLHPDVVDMHRANGLLAELAGGMEPKCLDDCLWTLLSLWRDKYTDNQPLMLAGNSVDFDRGFLRVHCPQTFALLSHRLIDVSVPRALAKAWGLPVWSGPKAHRALADCEASLDQLRFYRANMFPALTVDAVKASGAMLHHAEHATLALAPAVGGLVPLPDYTPGPTWDNGPSDLTLAPT